jgi:hypothetical protein
MDGKNFHFHEGIWYRVEMCEVLVVNYKLLKEDYSRFNDSFGVETPYVVNDYYGSYYYCGPIRKKYGFSPAGKPWYAKSKESACKKEIDKLKKKYNLS